MRAFTWSLAGATMGWLAGYAGLLYGVWGRGTVLLLAVATGALTFTVPLIAAALGGRAAGRLYNPSGAGTPRRREHSHAESLAARGLYAEAIAALEVAIAEDPSDPAAYLRVARLQRDRLARHEDAARWLRLGLEKTAHGSGLALLTLKEVVELYATKMSAPRRVAPLLARLAEERPGTPEAAWASEELVRLKQPRSLESLE